jgi:hypothetical protein
MYNVKEKLNSALYLLVAAVLSISLGTVANGVLYVSTDTEGAGGIDGGGGSSGGGGGNQGTDPETEPEPDPVVPEPEPEPQAPTEPKKPFGTEPVPPGLLPTPTDKPAYCDTAAGAAAQECFDRNDIDEETGLYPCNDGRQVSDPKQCSFAPSTAPPLENQTDPGPSPSPSPDPCVENPDLDECQPKDCDPVKDPNCMPIGGSIPEDPLPCPIGICKDGFKLVDGKCVKKNGNRDHDHDGNDIIIRIRNSVNNIFKITNNPADFEVDLVALGLNSDGSAMKCLMDVNRAEAQCEKFDVPADRISGPVKEFIEFESGAKDRAAQNSYLKNIKDHINNVNWIEALLIKCDRN